MPALGGMSSRHYVRAQLEFIPGPAQLAVVKVLHATKSMQKHACTHGQCIHMMADATCFTTGVLHVRLALMAMARSVCA